MFGWSTRRRERLERLDSDIISLSLPATAMTTDLSSDECLFGTVWFSEEA